MNKVHEIKIKIETDQVGTPIISEEFIRAVALRVVPPGFYTKDYLLNHIKEATELYRAVIRQLVQDSRYE